MSTIDPKFLDIEHDGEIYHIPVGGNAVIDDTAGSGDTDKAWSADKLVDEFGLKAPVDNPEFTGSISMDRLANSTVGYNSMAVGSGNTASNYEAFASGNSTIASGIDSHSEGESTTASGRDSHAEGFHTTASGDQSHAEGYYTTASGGCSHSEGLSTTAQSRSQRVAGEYNVLDNTGTATTLGTYAEIIGNGTGTNARSNARALDWNGNEYLNGDIYVNCNDDSTNGTPLGQVLSGLVVATTAETQAIIDEYGVSA